MSATNTPFDGFFSTFGRDQLANIHGHYLKERLKISKAAKYESDVSEASENIGLRSREILQKFILVGGSNLPPSLPPSPHPVPPHHTNVTLRIHILVSF